MRWDRAGEIRCDSASGAILLAATKDEIDSVEGDEFLMADQVDDAELPAIVRSPHGAEVAVFALRDDGRYPVAVGFDVKGEACALMIYV